MKILVFLIIFVFALSLFRMILEWSKNNNKWSHQRYKRLENNDLYRKSKLFSQNGLGFLFCCYKSVTTAIQNLMYN